MPNPQLYQLQVIIADLMVRKRLSYYSFFGDDGGDIFTWGDIKSRIGRADIAGGDGDAFDMGYFRWVALFNGDAVAGTQR